MSRFKTFYSITFDLLLLFYCALKACFYSFMFAFCFYFPVNVILAILTLI